MMLFCTQNVAWYQGEKIGVGEKTIGERSEPRGSFGRGKGGGAWRHAFNAADSPSSNQIVIEMSTRQVLITDVSMSLLGSCRQNAFFAIKFTDFWDLSRFW